MSIQSHSVLCKIRETAKKSEYPMKLDPRRKTVYPLGLKGPSFSYQKYEDEMGSILDLLAEQGYIKYVTDDHSTFCLKQKGIHPHQFQLGSLRTYLLDKWIDIIALALSIFAITKSYGFDLIALIINACKTLLGQ